MRLQQNVAGSENCRADFTIEIHLSISLNTWCKFKAEVSEILLESHLDRFSYASET